MSCCHEVRLDLPGLERVRFLIERPALSTNGDLESAFLDSATEILRHGSAQSLTHVLARTAARPDCDAIVMIRNPDLVLDADLPRRIRAGLDALSGLDKWAIAASGGLGLADARHLALYASQAPAIPSTCGPQPLLDPMPDLTLVNAAHAEAVLGGATACVDTGLETILALEGYLEGCVSVFLPRLTAGIAGELMGRDLNRLRRTLNGHLGARLPGQTIVTLTGEVRLDTEDADAAQDPRSLAPTDAAMRVVLRHCEAPGLSIVTRTRFTRPHLLRRLLTSISRARPDRMALEIILSSDAPEAECQDATATLQADFPHLQLRLVHNKPHGHSRVTNLVQGLRAARMDYAAIVDDDDYLDLFAFDHILPAFFMENRPVVFASSEVHEEVWENADAPRPALTQSAPVRTYPAARWREMFDGYNKLPICAMIAPRDFVVERLETVDLTHDLSEDYALFLLLLTARDLPAIHEVQETFCHISLRGQENSVGMEDRRPWVRDIAGHLDGLTGAEAAAGPGVWTQLSSRGPTADKAVTARAVRDLNTALATRDREIRLLRSEAARLRSALQTPEENPA